MTPEIDGERLERVFRDLVEIYSPSGKEEGVLAYLEEFCAQEGCPYGVQPVDDERYNLVLGRAEAPLVLVGHVDTVPAWDLEAIGPRDLGGGWVAGLGTADMKGGCAAMLEAFLCLRRAGCGNAVGLALVVGEEEEGDGAKAFLAEARPGRVLVGEPTALRLCDGHYGYVEVLLSARGRTAHASVPERGENAAEAVLRVLHDLLQSPVFARDAGAVLSIRHLETSNPGFAVPSAASAWLDVHVHPGTPLHAVRKAIDAVAADQGGGRVSVEYTLEQEGFRLPLEDPLQEAYRDAGGRETDWFRSHSDANLFHAAGIPTAVLGPGRIEYSHSEDERVPLDEVVQAASLYVRMVLSLLRKAT